MRPDATAALTGLGLLLGLAVPLLAPSSALACGPYFDHPFLSVPEAGPDEPVQGRFEHLVLAWAERTSSPFTAVKKDEADGDRDDAPRAMSPEAAAVWRAFRALDPEEAAAAPDPEGVPAEFVLYARAAHAFHLGQPSRAAFERVLDLPPSERRWRGVWAAYMLGTLDPQVEGAPDDRARWLERTRDLVEEGHEDTIGLGLASLRRQAWLLSSRPVAERDPAGRLDLFARYVAGGGRLHWQGQLTGYVRDVLADPQAVRRAARAEHASAVLTLALASRRGRGADDVRAWLDAMEGSPHATAHAGELAWLAHHVQDSDRARRWVARAADDDPFVPWVDAKLHLERGELEGAIDALGRAAATPVPAVCEHHHAEAVKAVNIELGLVLVAADRPVEAVEAFLDGGDWMDAAWVAERVLTTDELRALVDRRAPSAGSMIRPLRALHPDTPVTHDFPGMSGYLPMLAHGGDLQPEEEAPLLRAVLGRRLVREGHLEQAMLYLPPEARPHLDRVRQDLARGRDLSLDRAERASALWSAAHTWKMQGWALSSTELEPDQRVLGGWYPGADTSAARDAFPEDALVPTAEERSRRAALPVEERRYHFVWVADDLAREAMALMEDDHPDLPQAACVTGHWMDNRDPKRAWASELRLMNARPDHPFVAPHPDPSVGTLDEEGLCRLPDPPSPWWCSSAGTPVWWVGLLVPVVVRRRRRGRA